MRHIKDPEKQNKPRKYLKKCQCQKRRVGVRHCESSACHFNELSVPRLEDASNNGQTQIYTPQFECLSTCHTYSRSFGKDSKSDADNAERDTAPYYTRPSPVHPLYCPSLLKTFGLYWRIYVRIWVEWPTLTLCDVWLLLRRSSTSPLPVWH